GAAPRAGSPTDALTRVGCGSQPHQSCTRGPAESRPPHGRAMIPVGRLRPGPYTPAESRPLHPCGIIARNAAATDHSASHRPAWPLGRRVLPHRTDPRAGAEQDRTWDFFCTVVVAL